MLSNKLSLTFEEATEADIPEMTMAMTRAFDNDAQKHLGLEHSGPPGYDNGDFFREWLLGYKESVGYKIIAEDQIIGGFIVWIFEHGNNRLGVIQKLLLCQEEEPCIMTGGTLVANRVDEIVKRERVEWVGDDDQLERGAQNQIEEKWRRLH